jgi:predicted ferric reductase
VSVLADDRLLWFLNRGTGVVVLALLTGSVALGVLSSLRTVSARWPRFVSQAVHRNLSLLALAMLVAHAASAAIDDFVDIRWYHLVLPYGSGYRPFRVALGTLALDLILLVIATSLVRPRLGVRAWRGVHLTSYLAWLLGILHGLTLGTDRREPWSIGVTALSIGVVTGAAALRVASARQDVAARHDVAARRDAVGIDRSAPTGVLSEPARRTRGR